MEKMIHLALRTGTILPGYLGDWLIQAAIDPSSVRAKLIESSGSYSIVELQDEKGIARGGTVYGDYRDTVYVKPALEPNEEERTKRWRKIELEAALILALRHEQEQRRAAQLYENRFWLYIGMVALMVLLFGVAWQLGAGRGILGICNWIMDYGLYISLAFFILLVITIIGVHWQKRR